jgi:hypothetical protein
MIEHDGPCRCSRQQLSLVGCDCGAAEPHNYDADDRAAEAAALAAFEAAEQRAYEAEQAYWAEQEAAPSQQLFSGNTHIQVRYSTCDGVRIAKRFKSLAGARRFAQKWVGAHPDIGSAYAVSSDGIGIISVDNVSLADLFPAPK